MANIILYLYILQSDHNKFSLHSLPHIITIFFFQWELLRFTLNKFKIYSMLLGQSPCYTLITSPWLNWKFVPFDSFHPFLPPSSPAPGNHQIFSLVGVQLFIFLDSSEKWDHMILPQMAVFPFYGWIVLHCVCVCIHRDIHTHYIIFSHSYVDGHLDCFFMLSIVRVMLQWTWESRWLLKVVILIPLHMYPEVDCWIV